MLFALQQGQFGRRGASSAASSPPTFVSAQASGLGSVSTNDLVLLFLVDSDGSAVVAPTGWTRILNTTEANGYAVAIYKSLYDAGNAAANSTNFPSTNGYFETIVYAGPRDVVQVGTLTDSSGTNQLTISALASGTAANSALVAWYSSRDPATTMTSADTPAMTQRLLADAYTFFDSTVWEQTGAQSGSRSINRTGSSFNHFGILMEVR